MEEHVRSIVSPKGQVISQVKIKNGGRELEYYTVSEEPKDDFEQIKKDPEKFNKRFPVIPIQSVSLEEKFLQYEPQDDDDLIRIKASIIEAKEMGMKNFRVPILDPSFADDGETITYCWGRKPALGKPAIWWEQNALKVMPEKNSRLRLDLEEDILLGLFVRTMVSYGSDVNCAWEVLKKDFIKNLKPLKDRRTGQEPIMGYYDLCSTNKYLKMSKATDFYKLGVSERAYSGSLTNQQRISDPTADFGICVGAISMDE